MADSERPQVAFADLAVVLEFVLSGLVLEGAVVLAILAGAPADALSRLGGSEATLMLLGVALAYPFGVVADSYVLSLIRGRSEARVRQPVVCKYFDELRERNESIQKVYKKGIEAATADVLGPDEATRIVSAIHPMVSRKDEYSRSEIQFHRRVYRMARSAIIPSAAWLLLSGYLVVLSLSARTDTVLEPLLRSRSGTLIMLAASVFLLFGAIRSTRVRMTLLADHACRAFIQLTAPDRSPDKPETRNAMMGADTTA